MNNRYVLFTLLALVLQGSFLFAAKPSENRHLEILPDETELSITLDNMRVSRETGAPLALYRVDYPLNPDTPEKMALQYLRENVDLLQIREDLMDLKISSVRETPGGYHVRFRQYLGEYPVFQATMVVNINRQHRVTFVMNSYKPNVQPVEFETRVSPSDARSAALEHLNIQGRLQHEDQETLVYYRKGETRLVHQITLVPAEDVFGDCGLHPFVPGFRIEVEAGD